MSTSSTASEVGDGRKKSMVGSKRAKEWHEDQNPTRRRELWSWIGYDWSNSVFPVAAMTVWLPIFLDLIARDNSCGYTFEPLDKDTYNYTADPGGVWEGYVNKTTKCRYNWSESGVDLDPSKYGTDVPSWMERINPDYGLNLLHVYIRQKEHGRDEEEKAEVGALDIVREPAHLLYDVSKDWVIECDYTGDDPDTKFSPIRNVSLWAVDLSRTGEVGQEEGMPWYNGDGFQHYDGNVDLASPGAGDDTGPVNFEFTVTSSHTLEPDDFSFNSTNPHLVAIDRIDVVEKVKVDGADQTFSLRVTPTDLAVGSTSIDIAAKDSSMSFTLTTYSMPFCPYKVSFFGIIALQSVSFSLFVISASVIVQVALFMSLSSLGDFGPNRKIILLQSGFGGAISLMAMYTCDSPEKYELAGLLTIVTNALFGLSIVMYNAYLPYLTKSHPAFQEKMAEFKNNKSGGPKAIGGALKDLLAAYGDLQDKISTKGYLWGYIGGILALIVTLILVLVVFEDDGRLGLRTSILFTGAWWAVFTIPMIFFLEPRPGPPLPDLGIWYKATFSLRRQYASMLTLKHIPETRRFLIGYFLYSDAYGTIASVAMLFAKVELGMNMSSLILLSIISPVGAAIGLVIFRILQVRFALTSKQLVLITLGGMLIIPLWGIVGYSGVVGIVYPVEIFVLTVYYGFFNGVIQSASRTCFCDIIPPGQESEFFGVYEITDKGSSWMGPLICGILYEITGTMRTAFFYILFVGGIGFVLTLKTDFTEGAEACRRKEIQVRMEAVRNKLGVSKIQIQMNAKKFLGVKSGVSTASSVASKASAVESTVESTVETREKSRSKSILEVSIHEVKHEDVVEDTTDNLLHRASILEPGERLKENMPARKNSAFSIRSRASGSISMHHPLNTSERSAGRTSVRKASMLVISEFTGGTTSTGVKVMPEK